MSKEVVSAGDAQLTLSGVKAILLDIEGTTSSVKFVYDVLFPYVRNEVSNFLQLHWNEPKTILALSAMAKDRGHQSLEEWFQAAPVGQSATNVEANRELVTDEVTRLMDDDIKATGLKELQGLIWDVGYCEGKLTSHVYEDVPIALKAWKNAGLDVHIYSSGSINAQKVFFEHTTYGALTPYLNGHYDTTTGPKKEEDSYKKIAQAIGLPANAILFLSDTPGELEAARKAQMQVALVARDELQAEIDDLPAIKTFAQVSL